MVPMNTTISSMIQLTLRISLSRS